MAQVRNLLVDQGSHFSVNLTVYDSNSSGTFTANLYHYANGASQMRRYVESASATANIAVSIHTANTNGIITLSMNSVVTSGISHGRYVYDVELRGGPVVTGYSDGTKQNQTVRVFEGILTINPGVTQWDWT